MRKALGCVLGAATFVFGLVVVLPVMLWCLFWLVVANCLIWVFKKGCRVVFKVSGGSVQVDLLAYLELE